MKGIMLCAGIPIALCVMAGEAFAQRAHGLFLESSFGVAVGYVNNSNVDDNVGFAVDLAAGNRLKTKSAHVVFGIALGRDVTGPGDDVCRIAPNGGCAVFPSFASAAVLGGFDNARGTIRAWAGPSYNVSSIGGSSLGLQARADFTKWLTGPVGIGAAFRLNVIPNYQNDSYQLLALSLAIRIRQ